MLRSTRVRQLSLQFLLFAAYVGAARVGLSFASINPSATAIWPPTGIAIAACLLWGAGCWPAILAGAFVANILTAGSLLTSLGIAAGNTLEGVGGAYLITRFAGGRAAFSHAPDFFRFTLVSLLAPLASATIGVTVLSVAGFATWTDYAAIWLTWWLGDVSGALLIAPLLVLWVETPREPWAVERFLEATLLLGSLAASAYLVFGFAAQNLPLEFFTLPFLLWIAFRFGPRETATAVITLATIATWGTLRGSGPFGMLAGSGPLVLQAFMVTAAVTAMFAAVLVVERRRIERERLRLLHAEQAARREAESANAAKDRFMAMLGHELRNPLAAIVTAVHVIESGSGSEKTRGRAGEIVRRQVTHLTRLVDDLLDVGRLTADKLTLDRGPVNLADIAAGAFIALDAGERSSRVTVELDCEPAWVNGDATRLSQVAMNLITNAIQFTPPGGRVRVTTGQEADRATLVIADNGIGIDAYLLPRIFDLFRQGDADHTHHGLGIGLTLVKSLVELHGGTVEAASNGHNCGSVFTIRIPAIAAPASEARPSLSEPAAEPGGALRWRIVIAEDEPDLRAVLRVALEEAGHEVFEASSGPGAVDAVERFRPHAAVVDVGLPQFDGYEVARQVRRMPAGEHVLLVALTGYGHPDGPSRAQAAGFNHHLLKPIDPGRLNQLLAGREWR